MMPKYLYSYSPHSQGAKALAEAMGINRIKHENSKFRGGPNKIVINWGCRELPNQITQNGTRIINDPRQVAIASDKLQFFTYCHEQHSAILPVFTTNQRVAQDWLNAGRSVVARKLLRASSARGLEIVDPGDELPLAPLYTQYMKKKDEYRVHIVNDRVIDIQRKGLRGELRGENVNWRVRNLENGFIFVRNEDRDVPYKVVEFPRQIMRTLGLDFGAVDIIWNESSGCAYILEVNTAPGLVGSTIESYREALSAI